MDATSFKIAWESSGDELCQYPSSALSASKLPEETKHFLEVAGLPVDAAPFLNFGPQTLDWLGLPEQEQGCLYPVGSDGSGDAIVVDERGAVWRIEHEAPVRRSLVNSSVSTLVECLIAYRALVAEAIAIEGDDAFLDGRIPRHLIEAFSKSVDTADTAAAKAGTFWGEETSRLAGEAI